MLLASDGRCQMRLKIQIARYLCRELRNASKNSGGIVGCLVVSGSTLVEVGEVDLVVGLGREAIVKVGEQALCCLLRELI